MLSGKLPKSFEFGCRDSNRSEFRRSINVAVGRTVNQGQLGPDFTVGSAGESIRAAQ